MYIDYNMTQQSSLAFFGSERWLNSFSKQQTSALEETIETSICYNIITGSDVQTFIVFYRELWAEFQAL